MHWSHPAYCFVCVISLLFSLESMTGESACVCFASVSPFAGSCVCSLVFLLIDGVYPSVVGEIQHKWGLSFWELACLKMSLFFSSHLIESFFWEILLRILKKYYSFVLWLLMFLLRCVLIYNPLCGFFIFSSFESF